jgi:hypothetical protein
MKHIVKLLMLFCLLSPFVTAQNQQPDVQRLWSECKLQKLISFDVFNTAIMGLNRIKGPIRKNIITIIDFSKPSTENRFFVIDIESKHVLYNCLVAHGKNSGENFAESFSNVPESLMSSPGFFITAETYTGKHGYSLRVDGLEKGINDNARVREIVIHGADYVSDDYIKKYGRLGRSWGCPALPAALSNKIIDKIKEGTCLFVYSTDKNYNKNTEFLKAIFLE